MDARESERVTGELDAYAHWFVTPEPSSDGHFLTLTLFAEFGDTARVARDMTAVFLRGAGADVIVDDARLVVSELVGNVVNHAVPDRRLSSAGGCRRIDVTFKVWPKWLFIGVTDEDSTPPLLPVGEVFSRGCSVSCPKRCCPTAVGGCSSCSAWRRRSGGRLGRAAARRCGAAST